MSRIRVAVVMGGDSAEREISFRSGQAVLAGLDPARYDAWAVELSRIPDQPEALPAGLTRQAPDIAFLALHGGGGEGGTLQAALEQAGIPYTGSGPTASAAALDKIRTKDIFTEACIATPASLSYRAVTPDQLPGIIEESLQDLGLPFVVKPPSQGSTIGITIVRNDAEILPALESALHYESNILIEAFVSGVEITAAVLGNGNPRVLPMIEIVPESGFYDFHAKYVANTNMIVPARISPEATETAEELALLSHTALGCRGYSRVDMIVSDDDVCVLEVNTLPGMIGDHSLVPCAARAAGMSYAALLDEMIQLGLEEHTTNY